MGRSATSAKCKIEIIETGIEKITLRIVVSELRRTTLIYLRFTLPVAPSHHVRGVRTMRADRRRELICRAWSG